MFAFVAIKTVSLKDYLTAALLDIQEFNAALKGEEELQKFLGEQRTELLQADAAGIIAALDSLLPDIDKKAIADDSQMGEFTVAMFQEALRVSADGWADDDLEFVKPWGFELNEIKVPVLLYQGMEDKMVPYAHGVWLANHLPQDKLKKHLISGEGHISIFLGQRDHMIDQLLEMTKL